MHTHTVSFCRKWGCGAPGPGAKTLATSGRSRADSGNLAEVMTSETNFRFSPVMAARTRSLVSASSCRRSEVFEAAIKLNDVTFRVAEGFCQSLEEVPGAHIEGGDFDVADRVEGRGGGGGHPGGLDEVYSTGVVVLFEEGEDPLAAA